MVTIFEWFADICVLLTRCTVHKQMHLHHFRAALPSHVRIWTIPPWALFAHETVTHINIRACNFLSCAPRTVSALNGRTVTKLQFLLAPTVQGREHGIKIMALLCAHHWKWTRHHMWPWELQQGPLAKFVTHNVDWSTMWWWHTMNAWSLDTHWLHPIQWCTHTQNNHQIATSNCQNTFLHCRHNSSMQGYNNMGTVSAEFQTTHGNTHIIATYICVTALGGHHQYHWLPIYAFCTHLDLEISVPTRHAPRLHLLVHVVPVSLHVS